MTRSLGGIIEVLDGWKIARIVNIDSDEDDFNDKIIVTRGEHCCGGNPGRL